TFSFFPLFRMKIPNSLFDQCGLLPFSTLVFLMPKNEKKNGEISWNFNKNHSISTKNLVNI
ncbi:TPA: hypothetical protein ACSY34_13750, partial [Listeria monocytogenes]